MKCQICNEETKSAGSLAKHVKREHNLTSEEYFSKFSGAGRCVECGAATSFVNISVGYKLCCSKSCGAKVHRRSLKDDPKRFDSFRQKVASNMRHIHSTTPPEIMQEKRLRIAASFKTTLSLMTPAERQDKFGWMGKLTGDERQSAIKRMLEVGCHQWWKDATEADKEGVYARRAQTTREAWEDRGEEIHAKWNETFGKNLATMSHDDPLSEMIIQSLNLTFGIASDG